MTEQKRVAVLISGRGSNLGALLHAAAQSHYPARIELVVSNRPDAAGLSLAAAAGTPTAVIDHTAFGPGEDGRRRFDAAVSERLAAAGVDLICLAGFMRRLTPEFVERWSNRLINIHPSLLPAFRGLNVHERTIASGTKIAGCTVHFVASEVDAGPIIGQAALRVAMTDTPKSLAARILEVEHRLYPACLAALCEGRARPGTDGRVELDDDAGQIAAHLFAPTPMNPQP